MSELKAISGHEIREDIDYNTRGIDPEDKEWHNYGKELCDTLYYRKSEADKVIEEKDKEIAELKKQMHDAEMAKDDAEAANTEYRIEIESLKESQRWRKCSEEKPQDGQVVWAYEANNDRVLVLEYEKNDEGEGFICFSYKRDFYRSITHWMPYNKPKAPKEWK